jgi:hypothetical protein
VISLLVVATHDEVVNNTDKLSYTNTQLYFINVIQQQTLDRLLHHPIEGLEQSMYIQTHSGLKTADFQDVQTRGELNNAGIRTTADDTITVSGLAQLLENIADRLEVPIKTIDDIDTLLVLLSKERDRSPVDTTSTSGTRINIEDNTQGGLCISAGGT